MYEKRLSGLVYHRNEFGISNSDVKFKFEG